ncbi:MAG: bifunctional folylpolyglutamate synthase/dihydrofolate synthase [Gemmatimonadaceae bacterium]
MVVALITYRAAVDALFARTSGGWKLGLDTTRALLASLRDPHEQFPSVHVGGTNGKGSTVATLDTLLRAEGFRVGRYMSPHLVDFRERIVVDGEPIGEEDVTDFADRWMPDVERLGATFFEATTAMAFHWFAREAVDVAVVEVGLGGRLDATNVIRPVVAGVTSIGLDHEQYLGSTIQEIAREKAGIFKSGVPVVVGGPEPVAAGLLLEHAREAGAPRVELVRERLVESRIAVSAAGTRFAWRCAERSVELQTPLVGRHQAWNTAAALAMLELAGPPYSRAVGPANEHLAGVHLPGRFDRRGDVIFDVAHNPAGVSVLAQTLADVAPSRPIAALFAVLRDKDWRAMIEIIAPHVDHFVLTTPPSAPADRAWSLEEATAFARARGWSAVALADFDEAIARAREGAETTLVIGSFHTVGDAMQRLQVSPLSR